MANKRIRKKWASRGGHRTWAGWYRFLKTRGDLRWMELMPIDLGDGGEDPPLL
jgi:hypothetical protein